MNTDAEAPANAPSGDAAKVTMLEATATLGRLRQVWSGSFMVLNDQEIEINAPIFNEALRFYVKFLPRTPEQNEQSGEWKMRDGKAYFEFRGWDSPLGICTREPIKFGQVDEHPLYFAFANHALGPMNLVHWFFYLGDK